MLLSRLIPKDSKSKQNAIKPQPQVQSKLEDTNDGVYSLKAFLPMILQCGNHKYQHIRVMSARALVSLVSKNNLLTFLCDLIEKLPNKTQFDNNGNDTDSNSNNNSQITQISENNLHGLLLQIQSLFPLFTTWKHQTQY